MSAINWNNGQLITLGQGDTATCTGGLNQGQIYGLFFYNSAGRDSDTSVTITGSNSLPPIKVTVPGITSNQGLAAICFVSGDDTTTIAASVLPDQTGASITAFIGSVKMPMDPTGMSNLPLQLDGKTYAFNKFTRYYAVPASHWYAATISSNINMFVCVEFMEDNARVLGVNASADGINNVVAYYGPSAPGCVKVETNPYQSQQWYLQGNGRQTVWINADSVQNSQTASISVQSLQALYK